MAGTVIVRVVLACPPAVRLRLVLATNADMAPYEVTERFTVPVKPVRLVRAIIDWPVSPWLRVREDGSAVIRKSGPVTLTGR